MSRLLARKIPLRHTEEELTDLCQMLGLTSERDVDQTAARVFRIVLTDGKGGVKSVEVAQKGNLNRITAIHHLKRLESQGVVQKKENKYFFAFNDLEDFIDDYEKKERERFHRIKKLVTELEKELQFE